MSKFGETADKILEMLQNGEKLDIQEIKDRLSISDTVLINFMNEFGLIEFNEGTVRITESGLEFMV